MTKGLGRSVVVAFDDPVELVTVRAEARVRFSPAGTAALNPGFARRPRGNGDDRPAARERRRPRYSGVPADGG